MEFIVSSFSFLILSLHNFSGSWFFAIALLAVMLRGLLFPVQLFNFKQQKLLRKIQPELEEIQKKYKKDPARFFAEMNSIKRREGVKSLWMLIANLIQLPIFIGVYRSFSSMVSLSAGSFLWITSLGAPDPLFLFPLTVAVSAYAMQKIGASSQAEVSPQMTMVMKLMPALSMVFMAAMPSGLALFYAISGAIQLANEIVIRKMA